MAVQFVEATQATDATTTPDITLPTWQVGDVVLLAIAVSGGSNRTVTPPTGWTQLTRINAGTTTALVVAWRRMQAGDPTGIVSWSIDISVNSALAALCYRSTDPTTPIDVYATYQDATSSTANPAPSVTTTRDACTLVTFHSSRRNGSNSMTPASGMTERTDISTATGTADMFLGTADQQLGSAGNTGTRTATQASSSSNHASVSLALAPQVSTKTVTGSLPSPTGTVTTAALKLYTQTVTGSLPSPTGTVTTTVPTLQIVGVEAANHQSSGNAWTPAFPADVVPGDLLLFGYRVVGGTNTTVTGPTGWTLLISEDHSTVGKSQVWYATHAEGLAHTWTFNTGDKPAAGVMVALRGHLVSSPVDGSGVLEDTVNNKSITAPSVTTTRRDGMLVTWHTTKDQVTFTADPAMTMDAQTYSTHATVTNQSAMAAHQKLQGPAGDTGTRTATISVAKNTKHGMTVVVAAAQTSSEATQTVAGALPAPTGTVAAVMVKRQSVTGSLPSPTGTVTFTKGRSLTGTLLMGGDTDVELALPLFGTVPPPSGSILINGAPPGPRRSVGGALGALSGSLGRRASMRHTGRPSGLSGSLLPLRVKVAQTTGATGTLSGTVSTLKILFKVAATGTLPSPTGTVKPRPVVVTGGFVSGAGRVVLSVSGGVTTAPAVTGGTRATPLTSTVTSAHRSG